MSYAFGPNNEPDYVGDLLLWCSDLDYCVEKRTITNATGLAREYVVGEALDGTDIETITETDVDGILLTPSGESIANGASFDAAVLVRGPAVIDMDEVVLNGLTKRILRMEPRRGCRR